MGEEDYDRIGVAVDDEGNSSEGDGGRVCQWELGLPAGDDLTPLSQSLIPMELASAFRINPEPHRSLVDVHRACRHTISNLRRRVGPAPDVPEPFHPFAPADADAAAVDETMVLDEEELGGGSEEAEGLESSLRKVRRVDSASPTTAAASEEEESFAAGPETEMSNDDQSAKAMKRTRLVWTPQLHKRFVAVVGHLGIKNAVPKTIMQMMNVEGLTRENVASHLQKYRLYLKRMQGLSNEGPSASDQLFASTPVPRSLGKPQAPTPAPVPVPMPYAVPTMFPVPMFGMQQHPYGHGNQMAMVPVSNHQLAGAYHGFDARNLYGACGELPNNWSGGNQFGPNASYPHLAPSNK